MLFGVSAPKREAGTDPSRGLTDRACLEEPCRGQSRRAGGPASRSERPRTFPIRLGRCSSHEGKSTYQPSVLVTINDLVDVIEKAVGVNLERAYDRTKP